MWNSWKLPALSGALLLVVLPTAAATAGVCDGWAYRMKIRFAATVPGTLTNFPCLVALSTNGIPGFLYTDFNAPASGADLRFADSNETTALDYEIEKWDTNGSSYVWVKIPGIASTSDFVYAYWGNATNAPPCTTNGAAWTEGFAGVWHVDPWGGDALRDSTASRNDGVNASTDDAAGLMARGRNVDPGDYVQVPDSASLDLSDAGTLEAWVRLDQYPTEWNVVLIKGDAANDRAYGLWVRSTETSSCPTTRADGTTCTPAARGSR